MKLTKLAGMILVGIGAAGVLSATVPEIDPSTAGNALALVAGALLIVRSRRRR